MKGIWKIVNEYIKMSKKGKIKKKIRERKAHTRAYKASEA